MSNRLLKEHIIDKINKIRDKKSLNEIDCFLKSIEYKPNVLSLLAFAGTVSESEAKKMKNFIRDEFNKVEGEW